MALFVYIGYFLFYDKSKKLCNEVISLHSKKYRACFSNLINGGSTLKLNKIKKKIENVESIEDVLLIAKKHYKYISYASRASVFNNAIFREKCKEENSVSLKLVNELSLLFI